MGFFTMILSLILGIVFVVLARKTKGFLSTALMIIGIVLILVGIYLFWPK